MDIGLRRHKVMMMKTNINMCVRTMHDVYGICVRTIPYTS